MCRSGVVSAVLIYVSNTDSRSSRCYTMWKGRCTRPEMCGHSNTTEFSSLIESSHLVYISVHSLSRDPSDLNLTFRASSKPFFNLSSGSPASSAYLYCANCITLHHRGINEFAHLLTKRTFPHLHTLENFYTFFLTTCNSQSPIFSEPIHSPQYGFPEPTQLR